MAQLLSFPLATKPPKHPSDSLSKAWLPCSHLDVKVMTAIPAKNKRKAAVVCSVGGDRTTKPTAVKEPEAVPASIVLGRSSFPPGFAFGVASSAYQIEGAWNIDGRGPSIWDTFTHEQPHKIKGGSNGDVATDSYHRYEEDIESLKELGVDSYRFSISWSRILPDGTTKKINQKGIDYYNKVIDKLLENGITPFVTLFHWDVPQHLEDAYEGFRSRQIVHGYPISLVMIMMTHLGTAQARTRTLAKDRNLYTIKDVLLSDVHSVRRHTPLLGWQYIIIVLSSVMTRGSTTQRGLRGPASGKRTRGKVRSTSQVTENTSMTKSASASNATSDSRTDSFDIPARNPGHQDVHIDEILRPVGHGAYPPGWKPRNKRPCRDQERAAKRMKHLNGVATGVEERKGRGPNKCEKLKPFLAKGEPPWPLYFNTIGQPISNLATTFGYYLGDEARHYQRFPLHEEWGEMHKASFEDLWEDARII